MLAALSFVKVVRHTKLRSTCVYSVCMYTLQIVMRVFYVTKISNFRK